MAAHAGEADGGFSEGVLRLPWISRIARPEGVWRRLGRELRRGEGEVGRIWSGIDGMMNVMIARRCDLMTTQASGYHVAAA